MLAQLDPFSIGTSIGLVIAGILAAFKVRKERRNGGTTHDKLDRIERGVQRSDRKLNHLIGRFDQHVDEHTRR